MNNLVTYGQTFSKGQLTIPKKLRDYYGLGENFAYKMTRQDKKIIIEPQDQPKKHNLASALAKMTIIWKDDDFINPKNTRKEWDDRLAKMGI